MNPMSAAGITTEGVYDDVIEALRRVTVQIIDPTGNQGAGVIWSGAGLVMKNAHVVNGDEFACLLRVPGGERESA